MATAREVQCTTQAQACTRGYSFGSCVAHANNRHCISSGVLSCFPASPTVACRLHTFLVVFSFFCLPFSMYITRYERYFIDAEGDIGFPSLSRFQPTTRSSAILGVLHFLALSTVFTQNVSSFSNHHLNHCFA